MPAPVPLISVIVVCKNPGPRLHAALASIWSQAHVAPELIVIDGASTDGTREWLESQRARIARTISEPDGGVYDAMNKGVGFATGQWVLFLGADDRLASDHALSDAFETLSKTDADVVVGEITYDDGRLYRLGKHVHPLARNFVHHQGAFYRRALFAASGCFDSTFAIMGDYELNLRLRRNGVCFSPIPVRIAICASHGLSDRGEWRGYREEIVVRHRHAPSWRCWGWDALSIARYFRKQVIRRITRSHG